MQPSLRLIDNPVDRLARTLEALLVVAPRPLSVEELAEAAEADEERIETALGLLAGRYREGRSGIVLERAAGGYAFRAAREAAQACARLFDRPVQRGLSSAALETLAVVAYLGPVSRPEIARIRGVAADATVAGLVERGLVAEAGREGEGGAVRYETTPLFERVFGLAGQGRAAGPRGRGRRRGRDPRPPRVDRRAPRRLDVLDDRLGLVAAEAAEGLRVDASVLRDGEEDLVGGLVVGRVEDLDQVVAAERDVRVDQLPAALADLPLRLLDPVAPGGEAADPLRRPLHQRDVDRHGRIITRPVTICECA